MAVSQTIPYLGWFKAKNIVNFEGCCRWQTILHSIPNILATNYGLVIHYAFNDLVENPIDIVSDAYLAVSQMITSIVYLQLFNTKLLCFHGQKTDIILSCFFRLSEDRWVLPETDHLIHQTNCVHAPWHFLRKLIFILAYGCHNDILYGWGMAP